MKAKGHWHRIRLEGSALESPLEQERMLHAMGDAMVTRANAAAARRAAGEIVPERPARIYAHREKGVIVWYLDDGALALYRLVGGEREPEARLDALPTGGRLMRPLNGRLYMTDETPP
jgi:hypothetical protein